MKILYLIHQYWPEYQSGSENYTHYLAEALSAIGFEVTVVAADPASQNDYSIASSLEGRVRVLKVRKNSFMDRNPLTNFTDPAFTRAFLGIMEEVRPDVLHVQHLMFASADIPAHVKRMFRIPVIFTLHDFWLECCRTIRLDSEGKVCAGADRRRCMKCVRDDMSSENPTAAAMLSRLVMLKSRLSTAELAGVVLRKLSRSIRRACSSSPDWECRDRGMRALANEVDLFISPSRFLLKSFIRWGIQENRIVFSANGLPIHPGVAASGPREDNGILRIAFTSVVKPEKGLLVAIEAFDILHRKGVSGARLVIYGDVPHGSGFGRIVRAKASGLPNVEFGGAFDNRDIALALSGIHFMLLPSLWFENAPLVIEEAFQQKVPCIVSNLGGMAERVEDMVSGIHFEAGNAASLAGRIENLLDNPTLRRRLVDGIPRVKAIDENARELREIYMSF